MCTMFPLESSSCRSCARLRRSRRLQNCGNHDQEGVSVSGTEKNGGQTAEFHTFLMTKLMSWVNEPACLHNVLMETAWGSRRGDRGRGVVKPVKPQRVHQTARPSQLALLEVCQCVREGGAGGAGVIYSIPWVCHPPGLSWRVYRGRRWIGFFKPYSWIKRNKGRVQWRAEW